MPKAEMTAEHKEALAQGRTDGRAVRQYLEALAAHKPKRGRPFDVEAAQAEVIEIDAALAEGVGALDALQLAQRRIDLSNRIATAMLGSDAGDIEALEEAFIKAAAPYSERKGLTYSAWRAAGVSAAVLKKAGIAR